MGGTKRKKAILSLPLAQRLLTRGHRLLYIEPSRRRPGMLAFIFEYSENLDDEITSYSRNVSSKKA